jgi:hypothetical protein
MSGSLVCWLLLLVRIIPDYTLHLETALVLADLA